MSDLAHSYAARGWPVFPCRAKEEFDDITGEVLEPKRPLTPNGLRGASKNERIINEWWKRNPDAMVGVPTGSAIGAFVLDLDVKPGIGDGHDWLEDMEAEHGPLPVTARSKTMGGGTHIFFKHVDGVRNRGRLGVAVDLRGEGGYIIAPGSKAGDGRSYKWIETLDPDSTPIADAPKWLLDLLLPRAEPAHVAGSFSYESGNNDRYVDRAIEAELNELAQTGPGNRGYQLNRSAFSIGQFVGAGALHRSQAETQLWGAAVACGITAKDGERETRAKIRRGLDAGERQPRNIPAPDFAAQDNTRLVDVRRMIENGLKKKQKAAGADHADQPIIEDQPTNPNGSNSSAEISSEVLEPEETAANQEPSGPIIATAFRWIDPATLPRREFAYGNHYIRKYVSVTVSPGGLGKTSNSIVETLAMTSKRALTGELPPEKLRVWLFNAEDPRDEMQRRIMAACLHYNLKPEDIEGRLFLDTGREQELVIARDDKRNGVRIVEPLVEAIVAQIILNRIDVMIVDPFVSTHAVNENDNGAIDKVAKLWALIADRTNCAIDVVHHLRKLGDREATVEDTRGAVALIGAARSVRVLNRMQEDQAKLVGVPDADRFSYFWISQGKANLTKTNNGKVWRKLESVALGNGGGLGKPQDHAGVVTEWKWPSSEDIAETLTDDQLEKLWITVDNGTYKAADNAKQGGKHAVAYVVGLDVDDDSEKKQAAALFKALLKEGKLVEVRERDDATRKEAGFIRSPRYEARG